MAASSSSTPAGLSVGQHTSPEYTNWLALGHALTTVLCQGLRPFIKRETETFYRNVTAGLAATVPCTCVYVPGRRPNQYHDMSTCAWANVLEAHHLTNKPNWKQSDSTKWLDPTLGPWEIVKLFLPDLGGHAVIKSADDMDISAVLNLMDWCTHFTIPQHLIKDVRDTRNNKWVHVPKLEVTDADKTTAFDAIENLLKDPILTGDPDGQKALGEIQTLKWVSDLTIFESQVLAQYREVIEKDISTLKSEIKGVKEELRRNQERQNQLEGRLRNLEQSLENVNNLQTQVTRDKEMIESEISDLRNEIRGLKENSRRNQELQSQLEERVHSLEQSLENVTNMIQTGFTFVSLAKNCALFMCSYLIKCSRVNKRLLTPWLMILLMCSCVTILDPRSYKDGCPAEEDSVPFETKDINMSEYLNSARAENFIGRQWLYRELESTLRGRDISGVLIIGNPGTGKSALSSQLICSRTTSSRIHSHILGYHLCKYSDKNTQMAGKFVRNLAEMIARRLPEYGYLVSNSSYIQRSFVVDCIQNQDPVGCFEQTIMSPLRNLKSKPRENWYIVLDALDECLTQGETSHSIVYLLNNKIHRFPPWLKLVMTSRNETDASLHSSKIKKLIIDPEDPRNLEDIEVFLTKRLYQEGPLLNWIASWFGDDSVDSTTRLITALLRKSQGNFLFLKEVLNHWEVSGLYVKDAYAMPRTLGDLYHSYFQRLYPATRERSFDSARRVLEVLVATFEPLTQKEIFEVLRIKEKELDEEYDFKNRLKELGHFLKYGENDTVTLYHLSLTEWLTSEGNDKFFVSKKKGHEIFCDYYFSLIRGRDKSTLSKYILSLAQHIAYGGWKEGYVQEFLNFPSQTVNLTDPQTNRTLLHLASTINSTDVLELLLRHFSCIDCVDDRGMTPAFVAAEHGLVDNLALFVKRGADVNRKTNSIIVLHKHKIREALQKIKNHSYEFNIPHIGMPVFESKSKFLNATMLHAAAQRGHRNVVRFLLDNNASISTLDGVHLSAIQVAAEHGHLEIVKILHEAGAVADQTALHHAAENNWLEVVKFLLDVGVKDECLKCNGSFYWLKMTEQRLQRKLSNDFLLPFKETSRAWCSRHTNGPFNKSFFEMCVDWEKNWEEVNVGELFDDRHSIFCHSALHTAVASGHDKVVSLLLSKENNALACQDYTGRTPLHEVVRQNNTKIAAILLEKQPQLIHDKCKHWQEIATPIPEHQSFLSYWVSFDEIVEYHKDICHCGYTPLHLAARYGHENLGISLIIRGAHVNEGDCSGATPFHVAACHNQVGFISIFSHPNVHGDINSKALNGSTPLHSAAVCGAVEAIDYLLYHRANLSAVDENGLNALHYTIIHTKSNQFGQGVFLNDSWSDGTFELQEIDRMGHFKGIYKHTKQIENTNPFQGLGTLIKLIVAGLDIDAVDITGQAPLHIAARNGLVYAVKILLEANATFEKRDNHGKTPLELAIENVPQMGHFHNIAYGLVVELLLSYGASFSKCNRSESSLLHKAVIKHQPYVVRVLLLKGASLRCKDNLGRTPLVTYLHTDGKWIDVIIKAFNVSIAIKCGEPFNSSVFHLLCYRSPTISDDNFFVSKRCNEGDDAVACNVTKGVLAEAIENHPRKQEIINSCLDAEGFTPLHRAAQGANVIAIRFLLANGADDSILSPHRHDALTLAVLRAGSSLWRLYGGYNSEDHLLGITQASDAAIELLLHAMRTRGYRITCDSSKPELTLYHLAASRGLAKFIEVLLKERELHQLDVDCPNRDGITPMYLAKIFGNKVKRNLYNPWEHVVNIIESHGGEMRYPSRDAEYNIIYSRLYGWIPNDFALNLRPDIRRLMTSLLTLYEKKENKSFHCAMGVSLAKRRRFKNFNRKGNSLLIFLSIWEIIKMHLNNLRSAMDYNEFQRIMTDVRRCSWKHDQLSEYFSRLALHKLSYRQNISQTSNWESVKIFQMSWFQKELHILMLSRHKEIFGCFACTKSLYYNHKALIDGKEREINDLIQRYEESPPTFHLSLVCEILHSMFVDTLFHHLKIHALVGGSELCTNSEFVSERKQMLTGGNSPTLHLGLGQWTIKEYDWPLEIFVKRFLGLSRRFDYLRSLNVGTDQSTRVLLGKETNIPEDFLQLHRTLTQIYYS